MTLSVYNPDARAYRIQFACVVISAGRPTSRKFDTCFEMGDGDYIAATIFKRALKNPKLAERLYRYIDVNMARKSYEQIYGKAF